MTAGKHRSHKDDVVAALQNKETVAQFTAALVLLKCHLVHTREIPNGKDFLFLGPQEELHNALKLVVEVEHASGKLLHLNYVEVDQYFLLRVSGQEGEQQIIAAYFE